MEKQLSTRQPTKKRGEARRVEKSAANLRRKIIFYLRNKRHFSALRPHIFPVGIHSNLFTFVCMKSAIVLWETISLEGCLSGVVFSFRDFSQHFILHSWLSLFCCSFVEMVSSSCSWRAIMSETLKRANGKDQARGCRWVFRDNGVLKWLFLLSKAKSKSKGEVPSRERM